MFSKYSTLSVLGSRVWPFVVTWRHIWYRFRRYSTSNVTHWLTWPWYDL